MQNFLRKQKIKLGYHGEEYNMSLYKNMNKRKKDGTSRTKAKSTIKPKVYASMKAGFPKKKKKNKKKMTAYA